MKTDIIMAEVNKRTETVKRAIIKKKIIFSAVWTLLYSPHFKIMDSPHFKIMDSP